MLKVNFFKKDELLSIKNTMGNAFTVHYRVGVYSTESKAFFVRGLVTVIISVAEWHQCCVVGEVTLLNNFLI